MMRVWSTDVVQEGQYSEPSQDYRALEYTTMDQNLVRFMIGVQDHYLRRNYSGAPKALGSDEY